MAQGQRRRGRHARLTLREEHCWLWYFGYYATDEGRSDSEADRLAWRDMLSEFPRLRFYDGCEP